MNMHEPDRLSFHDITQIITAEQSRLLSFIGVRVKDPEMTEDIYQDTIERTVKRYTEGFIPTDVVSYMYRVAMNAIKDHRRRNDSSNTPEFLNLDDKPELLCEKPLPDHTAEMKQEMEIFFKCLQSLPPETSNILVMHKIHGVSNAEIARRIGSNPKTVEKRINRAVRSIQEQIERGVEPPGKRKWF